MELLYEIIELVVVDHVDQALLPPLAYAARPPSDINKQAPSREEDREELRCFVRCGPVVALLAASVHLRSVTLRVLSDALEIPVDTRGAGVER